MPMFMVLICSKEPFLYGRSEYFVSRRINRKQSLLPEHYLPVVFDVDGTAEDSSGTLSSSIASL